MKPRLTGAALELELGALEVLGRNSECLLSQAFGLELLTSLPLTGLRDSRLKGLATTRELELGLSVDFGPRCRSSVATSSSDDQMQNCDENADNPAS